MGQHAQHGPLVRFGACLAAAVMLLPAAGHAACRIALLLALDISSSVDAGEDAQQRQGLAAALMAPDVLAAITAVPGQAVALSVFEWSGQQQQDIMLDWMVLQSPADVQAAAAYIAASRRPYAEFSTAIGQMLVFADAQFRRAPPCDRQVLDVSGDGVHNDGLLPADAYAAGILPDVMVNGLPIVEQDDRALDHAADDDLVSHYQTQLIRGAGAFLIRADGFEDYERAMQRKLLRELTIQVGALQPGVPPQSPRQ